jgi:hypothetical protein
MQRETKTLTTPLGKELVLKAWLTHKERAEFATSVSREVKALGIDVKQAEESVEATLKILPLLTQAAVISYDGSQDKIDERLADLRADESDFVATEAAKVVKGNFQATK